MLTLTDRNRNTARQIFLNERGEEEWALLALPPIISAPPGSQLWGAEGAHQISTLAEFQVASSGTSIPMDLHVAKRIEARWEHPSENS